MVDLDALLDRADPARGYAEDTDDLIARLALAAAEEPLPRVRHWWKRPRIAIPVAIGAALLTTAGAAAIPLTMVINGTPADPEVVIPIHYTTDTGITVDCSYGYYVGDPAHRTTADQRIADYLNAQDWSGIGQEIYEKAMADPFVPGPNDDWEVDTQQLRDQSSFWNAESMILDRIPASLFVGPTSIGGTSTCDGRLR